MILCIAKVYGTSCQLIYEIPEELISLTKATYNNFECAVVEEGEIKNGFKSSLE